MRDPRDTLDVQVGGGAAFEGAGAGEGRGAEGGGGGVGRPFLQLVFRCTGQYVRAYRNAEGTGYLARCPGCGKAVRFKVGAGGTSERFFEVHC